MDGTDNGYEAFLSFPLFYLLGGGEHIHQIACKEWDAITWQYANYGTVEREFVTGFDWFHHSESYTYIYYLALSDPAHHINRTRALRYAAMYTGADPLAPNWDAQRKMVRSPLNGSKGPRFVTTQVDWDYHRPILAHYLAPFEDIPGADSSDPLFKVDWTDDEVFARVLDLINRRMTRGDVPLNLNIASLITNAYLYTGEDQYKAWVLDYLQAWEERCKANGGIMPDNIGPEGTIGELMDGKWWGGYYGWRWPHGARNIVEPALVAGSCALLMTGDDSHLDLARSQLDMLWEQRREEDGLVKVPTRHGDQGWFDFRSPDPYLYIHLYYLSQKRAGFGPPRRSLSRPRRFCRSAPRLGRCQSRHLPADSLVRLYRGQKPKLRRAGDRLDLLQHLPQSESPRKRRQRPRDARVLSLPEAQPRAARSPDPDGLGHASGDLQRRDAPSPRALFRSAAPSPRPARVRRSLSRSSQRRRGQPDAGEYGPSGRPQRPVAGRFLWRAPIHVRPTRRQRRPRSVY